MRRFTKDGSSAVEAEKRSEERANRANKFQWGASEFIVDSRWSPSARHTITEATHVATDMYVGIATIFSVSHSVALTPWGTGARDPPPLLQMAGHGGPVSRRTANKKLTKLYWSSRKRSPKRLIVLLEPKSGGARTRNFFFGSVPPIFAPDWCPHFQIRSCATDRTCSDVDVLPATF